MKKLASPFILIACILLSCSDDESVNGPITATITGKAQKGPFVTNSVITISELASDLTPTGRTFNARTLNDEGEFELADVELESNYIEVKVEGLYYNEISGNISNRELTIASIAEISNDIVSNVNLMTQLINSRLKELINQGIGFNEAKAQAQNEFSAIFHYEGSPSLDANRIDLADGSNDAAFLFAISTLFLYSVNEFDANSYASWLAFILNFELDFGDNGVIDDPQLLSRLTQSAPQVILNALTIIERFEAGNAGQAPNFLPIVQNFREKTELLADVEDPTNELFPATTENGINILALRNGTRISASESYVIAVNIPESNDFDLNIGVYADFVEGSSFSASSIHWDGSNIEELNSHYDMNLNPTDQPGLLEIPIQMTGSGQIAIFIHSIINGVDNGVRDSDLFWVQTLVPIEDADTIRITEVEDNNLYVDQSSYSEPVFLIYEGIENLENISFHISPNVIGVSFPDLTTVNGIVYFHINTELRSINFDVLEIVGGYFYLNGNSSLTSVYAPNISSIGEYLYVDKNFNIQDFNLAGRALDEDFSDIVSDYQYICRLEDGGTVCTDN